ncbi:hypothetical protein CH262_20355 [Rhodococcus sp. 05-2255-1e]|uniref:glycosyltransferase family 4 protein n=1 Tax=Rhodococcus sp. 05-2255-1e TaxID=2022495 RepID=UPI000B9AEE47|nr:glycosyltransferase family 4 protein [Rhodococcus sp. 05-2255-1e]OZE21668.1 hypothetical protein CH262_20355 [Rhodococcus sp. 05-2255-1e]
MRITSFISSGVRGGAETYLEALAVGMGAEGSRFRIVGSLPPEVAIGVPKTEARIGPKWSKSTLIRSLKSARSERSEYLRAAEVRDADVFHCQYKREQILLSRSLSRTAPVVWTEHGEFLGGGAGWILGLLYRRASRHVSTVICVSESVRSSLELKVGVDPKKLTTIENSVHTRFFQNDSPERATNLYSRYDSGGEIQLVVVSRLEYSKGVDRAIDALGYLPDNFKLTVVGEGAFANQLKSKAREFGGRVKFTGYLSDTKMAYSNADLFLCLSRPEAREGVPISILEAAASGLHLIVSEDSGLKSWCAANGILTVRPDPAIIADLIRSQCGNPDSGISASRALAKSRRSDSWLAEHIRVFGNAVAGRVHE